MRKTERRARQRLQLRHRQERVLRATSIFRGSVQTIFYERNKEINANSRNVGGASALKFTGQQSVRVISL